MSHIHFVQKQPIITVKNDGSYLRKDVGEGQIRRLDHVVKKPRRKTQIIDHYLYFKGTYIDRKIEEVFRKSEPLDSYQFSSYDIALPSFIVCQIPGLVVKTKILYDPKYDEKEIKNVKAYFSKHGEPRSMDLKNYENVEKSLKLMNMNDLFKSELHIKRNDATCPKKSTFFPIIRQIESEKFSFIDCLKMYDVNNRKNWYFYLPIQGPIDKGGRSYPNIIDGTVPFYVILNENEFRKLNKSLNEKINKFSDIENLQAATKLLKEMRWSLSYRVRDGLNFALIYDGKTIFGYHNNKSYRYHPPTY